MTPMDETKFWALIDEARTAVAADSEDPQQDMMDVLQEKLEDLAGEEIIAFQEQMRAQFWRAFTYDLSAAIYVIRGDKCDADDFLGFRGWLISRGQRYFDRVLADPDSLGEDDLVPTQVYLPDILKLAAMAYRETTGEVLTLDPAFVEPDEPAGKPLEIQDIPTRLPKLCDDFVFVFDEEETEELTAAEAAAKQAAPPKP